jgi:ATP-dependent 26S proteasome regulatory subunit
MNTPTNDNWHVANQRYLMAALGVVREALERFKSECGDPIAESDQAHDAPSAAHREMVLASENLSSPSALDTLAELFNLSSFERNVLLLCAGIELDSSFSSLLTSLRSDPARPNPTFSLALATLPDAHWSALTPAAPLRYWRLVEFGEGHALTTRTLRIDERILHFLTGVQYVDERLSDIIEPVLAGSDLVPSHRKVADVLKQAWMQASGQPALPVFQLCGEEASGMSAIAAAACSELGLSLHILSAFALPEKLSELAELVRLWEREATLNASVLLLDCNDVDPSDAPRIRTITRLCETMRAALIISSRKRSYSIQRSLVDFDVKKPSQDEQHTLWQHTLGAQAENLNGPLSAVVSQFNLDTQTILSAGSELLRQVSNENTEDQESPIRLENALWDMCCAHTRPRLDDLAQRIQPSATWTDIILPEQQNETLREIATHVRHRQTVYGKWGFEAVCSRGLGISALFAGSSGTGKTMAAEVLANELRLDLYKIDLSQVVNKYIGETEKNLKRVFDAAEEGGAILLFDEADALFGRRSEVKDSHDRYANIEVSYLLQRMEAYRGLAILTTNMKSALDNAFLRRIRFVLMFPFPDAAHRSEIWRGVFPADTPTDGLDVNKLARLNVSGGNIRNIALHAAFLAAEQGEPVRMTHLSLAARGEYSKLEKPMSNAELSAW